MGTKSPRQSLKIVEENYGKYKRESYYEWGEGGGVAAHHAVF